MKTNVTHRTLGASAGAASPIFYFVEGSSDAVFSKQNTTLYPLGGLLSTGVALGNVTRYWRARAKYIESDYSPYIYFGTAANPTAVAGGLVGSADDQSNVASNYTNFATVDSIDAGGSATARIYGTGGVGSAWTRQVGSVTTTYPAGTITGLAYTTVYYIHYTGTTYAASTTFPASLPDTYIWVGKITTVAAGGGGGSLGGGGSSGGGGGRPNPN